MFMNAIRKLFEENKLTWTKVFIETNSKTGITSQNLVIFSDQENIEYLFFHLTFLTIG